MKKVFIVVFVICFMIALSSCSSQNNATLADEKTIVQDATDISENDSQDEKTDQQNSYSPSAVSGAVILEFDGTKLVYQEKCENCGNVEPGKNTIAKSNGAGQYTSSFVCSECKESQEVKIK